MVRVCVSLLFPLAFLPGCATEQAQAPASPSAQVNPQPQPPAKETFSDCARKNSVVDAWTCALKD